MQQELTALELESQKLVQELSEKSTLSLRNWAVLAIVTILYGLFFYYSRFYPLLIAAILVALTGFDYSNTNQTWEQHPKILDFEARRQALQRDIDALRDSKETDLA